MKFLCKVLLPSLLLASSAAKAQIITTVAGDGSSTYAGDSGPATAAGLDPFDVKCDAAGNLYIAERSNRRIRKVTTAGTITTYAGGSFGALGDGGPATGASLSVLNGIAMDRIGNLYIADGPNNRIRKVDTFGIITTIAGSGTAGASGDGGPATAATLSDPYGVAVDSAGNVFIAESYFNKIRKIDLSGTITTFAGTGAVGFSGDGGPATNAQFSWPTGLAFDKKGNLYVADFENNRIRKITPAGNIYTVAGSGAVGTTPGAFSGSYGGDGGPATAAFLNSPCYLTVDPFGSIYFCDYGNSRVRKVDTLGTITTICGTATPGFSGDGGPATAAQIEENTGIGSDLYGNVYLTDNFNSRVRKVTHAFVPTSVVPAMVASCVVIAPNPATSELRILHAPERTMLQVFNVAGGLVYSGITADDDQFILDISGFLPGLYVVHLTTARGEEINKTIVKL